MPGVTLKQVIKNYGETRVIHGIDLHIEPGEFCVFVGPSGCGKSTLLRMVAGLEETTEGTIHIGKRDVTNVEASDRGIAMVFQTYALYPHMTVEQNIGFSLKMNKVKKEEINNRVAEVASILKLDDYMNRKSKALSGGQRQRVAIGRALVRNPDVFLFDEPLSNLDAELRVDMRVEIARLHQEIGATMIYVTHDQVEAMTLADKIVVLRSGVIEQVGSPMELYSDPNNKFVAGFIGSPSMNFLQGSCSDNQTKCAALPSHKINSPTSKQQNVIIGIRPEHLNLDVNGSGLKVDIVEKLGSVTYIHALALNGEKIIIEYKGLIALKAGQEIGITFESNNLLFFDADTEQRLR